ncbi:MAG: hypothetical protein K2R93_13400 [Gemmatimonadaceae bacterium]|nr:hypothetical protein [Gemmatimonadaceae bacterium]
MLDLALLEHQIARQRRRKWVNGAVMFAIVCVLAFLVMDVAVRVLGVPRSQRMMVAFLAAPPLAAFVVVFIWTVLSGTETVAHSLLHPPSGGPVTIPTSGAEALFTQGDIEGSMAAFDALRDQHGATPELLRREADLHLGRDGRPERARELLIRLRQTPGVSRGDELFATQRLIDLYFGALRDEPRALSEMRRLVERFPGTRDAEGARAELERRRQR